MKRFFIIVQYALIGAAVITLVACNQLPFSPTALASQTYPVALKKDAGDVPAPTLQAPAPAENTTVNMETETAGAETEFTQGQWSAAPACANEPLTLSGWQSLLGNNSQGAGLLAETEIKSQLAALQLNLQSGRLNRETQIDAAGLPGIETVGDLLDRLEQVDRSREKADPALLETSQQVQAGVGITLPVCARMLVTQAGSQPEQVLWSGEGIQAQSLAPATLLSRDQTRPEPVKDTGIASPDGKRAAFTSLQVDAGGPIYVLDLQTGAWTDLIQKVNENIKGSQPALADDLWWEIAGWMPDSQRLALAPADLSAVFIIDLSNYTYKVFGFDGGGAGGTSSVHLSPDGTRFAYLGLDPSGGQSLNVVDLASGEATRLGILPAEDGYMLYPRFSPDGSTLAYLVQRGHPLTGITYSINLFSFANSSERILVQGNLGNSVPTWSPDGQYIAFTKKEPDTPDLVIPDQTPEPMRGNIWLARVQDGALTQLTFIDGWTRSPAWSGNAHTLAFVTQDGQVGMVNIEQPGRTWLAAQTSAANPLVTSAFFVP